MTTQSLDGAFIEERSEDDKETGELEIRKGVLTADVRVVWQQSREFCQMGLHLDPPCSAITPQLMRVMHCAHSAVAFIHPYRFVKDEHQFTVGSVVNFSYRAMVSSAEPHSAADREFQTK